jgi:hypothetical protein
MGAIGRAVVTTAAVVALAFLPLPAAADEPGESDEARVLALQAIALIVNTPDEMHEIEERIEHAMEAPHKEGVDLEGVEQAMTALEEGDLQLTRELLQTAIGAGPFVSEGVPEPVGETSGDPGQPAFSVGAEAGTTVVLAEFRPDSGLDGGDVVVLAVAVATMAAGALMAWWFRPPESVRQLRREAAASKGA